MKIFKFNENNSTPLTFKIDEFEDVMQLLWEKNEYEKLYEIVDHEEDGVDIGKGIIDAKVVIKRLSDGKLFQFEYSHDEGRNSLGIGGLGNPNIMVGTEVYPHTITKIVYKPFPQK